MPPETEVFETFQGAQRCAKELAAKYRATISLYRNEDGTYSVDLTPVIRVEHVDEWEEEHWHHLAQQERDEENALADDEYADDE